MNPLWGKIKITSYIGFFQYPALLRQQQLISRSIYTLDTSKFIVSNQKEESISAEMVNGVTHDLIETPFNKFASRADPDQAALLRAS